MIIGKCPLCGSPLENKKERPKSGLAFQSTKRFANAAAVTPDDLAPGSSYSRELPIFLPTLESNVAVPRSKAMTSAAFAGPFYGLLVGVAWYGAWVVLDLAIVGFPSPRPGPPVVIGLIAGATAWFLVAWRKWEGNAAYYDDLLSRFEEVVGLDIDRDGQIGQPEKQEPVQMEVVHRGQDGFRQMLRFDLPAQVDEAGFYNFAAGVTREGRSLAESQWIGRGQPFSRNSYGALLQAMEQAGIVRWVDSGNHAAGRELTGGGRRALLQFVYTCEKAHSLTHAHSTGGDDTGYVAIDGVG